MSLRAVGTLAVAIVSSAASVTCLAQQGEAQGGEPARFGRFVKQIEGGFVDPTEVGFLDDGTLRVWDVGGRYLDFDPRTGEPRGSGRERLAGSRPYAGQERAVVSPDSDAGLVLIYGEDGEVAWVCQGPHGQASGRHADSPPFIKPGGAALSTEGNLFVADTGEDRIYHMDPEGELLNEWGGYGAFPGLLNRPMGLAFHDGHLYVADSANHRIQVFTPEGEYVYEWGLHVIRPHEGEGRIHYPSDIAISPDGRLAAVAEPIERRVQVFTLVDPDDPAPTSSAFFERADAPHFGDHIAIAGELMVTTEPDTGQVVVWTLARAAPIPITRIGKRGDGMGQFREPGDVAIDYEKRRVWVADPWSRRVSVFQLDWEPGDAPGYDPFMAKFVKAYGLGWQAEAIELLPDGFCLHDRHGIGVAKIAATGDQDKDWGWKSPPDRGADYRHPRDLATGAAREIVYILDRPRAGPAAEIIGRAADSGEVRFRAVVQCAADMLALADDRLFVTCGAEDTITSISLADGNDQGTFGSTGLGPAQFFRPAGIAVAEDGRLYVVDRGNHRVQVLEPDGTFVTAFGARLYVQPALNPDAPAP